MVKSLNLGWHPFSRQFQVLQGCLSFSRRCSQAFPKSIKGRRELRSRVSASPRYGVPASAGQTRRLHIGPAYSSLGLKFVSFTGEAGTPHTKTDRLCQPTEILEINRYAIESSGGFVHRR